MAYFKEITAIYGPLEWFAEIFCLRPNCEQYNLFSRVAPKEAPDWAKVSGKDRHQTEYDLTNCFCPGRGLIKNQSSYALQNLRENN